MGIPRIETPPDAALRAGDRAMIAALMAHVHLKLIAQLTSKIEAATQAATDDADERVRDIFNRAASLHAAAALPAPPTTNAAVAPRGPGDPTVASMRARTTTTPAKVGSATSAPQAALTAAAPRPRLSRRSTPMALTARL
jgi:hypothetical protein